MAGQGRASRGVAEVLRALWGSGEGVQKGMPKPLVSRESRLARPRPQPRLPGDGAVCSYRPIVDYIDAQFENYLQEELKIRRSLFDFHDTRIHVCLYFITPTGHSLKSLDLVTMKKLDSKVSPRGHPQPVPRAVRLSGGGGQGCWLK